MKTNQLLSKKIFWKKHETDKRYFYHYEGDKVILLRINNFPEEPLYTIINGLDILDMEDRPKEWKLEIINESIK